MKNIAKKLLDSAKKSTTDAIKTASRRAIAEATGYLIGNKIIDKTTSHSKTSKDVNSENNWKESKNEIEISKERYISQKGNKLLMN